MGVSSLDIYNVVNYFAHGRGFIDDPYFLAGTAVPDWLNVVNRRAKARSRLAEPFTSDGDARVAALANGILRHHHDDGWFHQSAAFAELSLEFTVTIRDMLEPDAGFRPSFLGHILVEILLDATLIQAEPQRLDDYYLALAKLDSDFVSRAVNRMVTQPVGMLSVFIQRFSDERFLYDYSDDEKLLFRLNHVMRRVRLPALPPMFQDFFASARTSVERRQHELLAGPESDIRENDTPGADDSSAAGR